MSPSVSRSQQRLMQAAEHGADFPLAIKVRQSMTPQQLHDFASGSEAGKPQRVRPPRKRKVSVAEQVRAPYPHRNLGNFLHPPRQRMASQPEISDEE